MATVYGAGATGGSSVSRSLESAKPNASIGANTADTVFDTITLPAGVLAVDDQDWIRIIAWGTFTLDGVTPSATPSVRFGSTVIASTLFISGGDGPWRIEAIVRRRTSITQDSAAVGVVTSATLNTVLEPLSATTPGETLANAIAVTVRGTTGVGAGNGLTCLCVMVEFFSEAGGSAAT